MLRNSDRLLACGIIVFAAIARTAVADEGSDFFESQIRPLLVRHCLECHSAGTKRAEGDLKLDQQEAWLTGGARGPAIVPGDADASLLIRAVRYRDAELQMPPSQPLPAAAVAAFERWVQMGAPGPATQGVIQVSRPSDPVAGKQHWAFQALTGQAPANSDDDWSNSPIDASILARQRQEHLQPVGDASRADLLRRLTMQIIGLPPSFDDVETFTADDRPDAVERMIDRLLASPHFGERWGRHWLDLARYADSNGLDENFLFREAWRYRNWVIQAVNDDLPWDRFLLEQLAGDLLPSDSIEQRDRQRIAAGFLLVGPKVLLGNEEQRQRMEVADELIDTVGRAVLGQTLGCARCHDHKFDPIPTADYYALAGIFSSTTVMETRYMLGEQRSMERLVGLGLQGEAVDDAYEVYWREQPRVASRKKSAETALEQLKQSQDDAIAKLVEQKSEVLAEGARDAAKPREERIAAQAELIAQLTTILSQPPPIPPRAMIPVDRAQPTDEHVRVAGQIERLGEQVPRGFLTVLCDGAPMSISPSESGRVPLARWLFDCEGGAGRLTARVLSNRAWHHLLGRGIVRTVDNFGRTGETPSHPELLDVIARDLVRSGWSLKSLIRRITSTHTFVLSSDYSAENDALDPDNRWLWRAHRRRLDPESLRDAMLVAAGRLDPAPMNSSVWYLGDQATAVGPNTVRRRTDFPNRSVYLPVIRNDLPELFEAFDFTNPQVATGARPQTTAPTQGLFMLNADLVMELADAVAQRVLADPVVSAATDRNCEIDALFRYVFNSVPTDVQRGELREFLEQTLVERQQQNDDQARVHALGFACHALFASTKFQFVD